MLRGFGVIASRTVLAIFLLLVWNVTTRDPPRGDTSNPARPEPPAMPEAEQAWIASL
jgi:hypothetical protein